MAKLDHSQGLERQLPFPNARGDGEVQQGQLGSTQVNPGQLRKNKKMEALHEEFEDVFSDRLLPGKRINMAPVDIQLEKEAKPRAFYHCKQYPLYLAEQA